jgi:hypothetical protein
VRLFSRFSLEPPEKRQKRMSLDMKLSELAKAKENLGSAMYERMVAATVEQHFKD